MSSLSIGSNLVKILSLDKDITKVIGDRVFPVIADEGTVFPFMVYRRSSINTDNNKDFGTEYPVIMIQIAATSYAESVSIAEMTRKALEHKSDDIIEDIIIQDANEDWLEDIFIQNITFIIKLK